MKNPWMLWKTPDGQIWDSDTIRFYNKISNKTETVRDAGGVPVPAKDCEFVATLKLVLFYHGRSCHFYFNDIEAGRTYMMQATEMETILMNHTLYQGLICGRWGWVNRSGKASIKLLEELEDMH